MFKHPSTNLKTCLSKTSWTNPKTQPWGPSLKIDGSFYRKNGHCDLFPLTNRNIAVIELHITGGCRVGVFQQSILSSVHTVGHKGHRRLSNHLID